MFEQLAFEDDPNYEVEKFGKNGLLVESGIGMSWLNDMLGHNTLIAEHGAEKLVASCNTCNSVVGTYAKAEFPKYRLAMSQARTDLRIHSLDKDLTPE